MDVPISGLLICESTLACSAHLTELPKSLVKQRELQMSAENCARVRGGQSISCVLDGGGEAGLHCHLHPLCKGMYFVNLREGGPSGGHRHRELPLLLSLPRTRHSPHRACFPGTTNQRSWCQLKRVAVPTAGRGRLESVSLCDPWSPRLGRFSGEATQVGGPRQGAQGELLSQKASPLTV